jgi:uncharacterized membrane protein YfcA
VDPGPLRDALTVVLGVATGVLSALFGVGGAVLSTPGIRLLGANALIAVGTTLPSIFPSAVSGTARYVKEKMIDWRAAVLTAPAGMAASVGGSLLSKRVPGNGHVLMILTAGLLGITAWRMARPGAPPPESAAEAEAEGATDAVLLAPDGPPALRRDRPATLVAIGVAAGGLSGLLGVGGGIVMVPAFAEYVGLPLKTAIATSLVCVAVLAVPGTVTHALLGNIDWRFAIGLAVGVVPGARIGAAITLRATDARLRRAVSLFFGAIAVVYATAELAALVR